MKPKTAHVEDSLGLLLEQSKHKPGITGLLTALMRRVQDAEDALWDIDARRRLTQATGVELDGMGAIVGLERRGLSGDTYRTHLRGRILLNRGSGTPAELVELAASVTGGSTPISLREYPPATLVFELVSRLDEATASDVAVIVGEGRPAGVRVYVQSHPVEPVFAFDFEATFGNAFDLEAPAGTFAQAMLA